ncbi:helix-turn-helix transcriptional regulator [Actinomadura kijaniata]|uniref:DUF6597 domain-containing transcriptional factor n=1 Tax=Actinomadura kijaniata TaxID=46161 RepID=UPI001C7194F1
MQGVVNPTGYRETAADATQVTAGVACVWESALPAGAEPFTQRVVPDGCVDVVWWAARGLVQVAGPDTGPVPATIGPGDRLVGVRFRPGAAVLALGVPADAVRDGRVPLRELWGDGAERLAEALAGAADPGAVLAGAVVARAAAGGPADPLAPALARGLVGGASVREVAVGLGLSERQVRRRAVAAFGYGPKTVQRVLRFQRALRLARAGRPLAEVAQVAGYADQAHMANEVRGLGGVPMRGLL